MNENKKKLLVNTLIVITTLLIGIYLFQSLTIDYWMVTEKYSYGVDIIGGQCPDIMNKKICPRITIKDHDSKRIGSCLNTYEKCIENYNNLTFSHNDWWSSKYYFTGDS